MFIPDTNFSILLPGSRVKRHRILDPIRNKGYFLSKKLLLSSRKYDPGIFIQDPERPLLVSYIQIPDPGAKKALDPGSGFATLTILLPEYRSAIAF
jgi:hypothetical protein